MKYFKFLMFGLLAVSLATATSCNKEVVGPQGEQGIQGEQGPKGDKGNANVIGTNEVTISNWTQSGSDWTATLTAQGVTQSIVNTGLVQVFVKYGSQWWVLPDQNGKNQTTFGYSVGQISILNMNVDNTTPANPGAKTFRVVIIPSSGLITHPNVDYTNYDEIAKAFNLD